MEGLLGLIITALVIVLAIWLAKFVCESFKLPAPVFWITVLLLVLLSYVLKWTGLVPSLGVGR